MDDLVDVCVGRRFRVSMTRQVAKQFGKVAARERARCQKWMGFYSNDGHDFLDDEKLKHEGKFPTGGAGGAKVAILAFKAWQVRVYGGVVNGNHFIATEIDAAKKSNAADQDILKFAAKKLQKYMTLGEK